MCVFICIHVCMYCGSNWESGKTKTGRVGQAEQMGIWGQRAKKAQGKAQGETAGTVFINVEEGQPHTHQSSSKQEAAASSRAGAWRFEPARDMTLFITLHPRGKRQRDAPPTKSRQKHTHPRASSSSSSKPKKKAECDKRTDLSLVWPPSWPCFDRKTGAAAGPTCAHICDDDAPLQHPRVGERGPFASHFSPLRFGFFGVWGCGCGLCRRPSPLHACRQAPLSTSLWVGRGAMEQEALSLTVFTIGGIHCVISSLSLGVFDLDLITCHCTDTPPHRTDSGPARRRPCNGKEGGARVVRPRPAGAAASASASGRS